MPTVLITGGTGTIGKRLSQMLVEKNYDVIILTRQQSKIRNHQSEKNQLSKNQQESKISYANWDIEKELIDKDAIAKADSIIHLAGAGVAEKRWTKARKKEIVESRTKSSALLIKALSETSNKTKAIVSASAIGWYGADTNESRQKGFQENQSSSNDFLGTTCKLWEQSIEPVENPKIRLVKLRTGIVLSNDGGAFIEFKKPLKYGIGAIFGNGEQIISWIHVDDICRMYIYALEKEQLLGAYNAVAPKTISNKNFMLQLSKKIKGKTFLSMHVPSFILKLILGKMSFEVLKSTTVNCEKIKNAGFTFLYPSVEAALANLIDVP